MEEFQLVLQTFHKMSMAFINRAEWGDEGDEFTFITTWRHSQWKAESSF